MANPTAEEPETNPRLNAAIARFLDEESSEVGCDRARLLDDFQDVRSDLEDFLLAHDRMNDLAAGLRPTASVLGRPEADATLLNPSTPAKPDSEAPATLPNTDREEVSLPVADGRLRYFGDYELLEEIARGGMGVVYRARQVTLNRVVAVKMILSGQLASREDIQRFRAEAEAAAHLDHPGIVPVHEVGEHNGQHYFSMGFVDGPSLTSELSDGPLAPRRAVTLVRDVAEAVEYAHGKGVIHRDLKPGNILLDRSGQPRITDFGLAKRLRVETSLTATGQILGTPSYMPPEQAAGRADRVQVTADVYSLGAVLYACLTGRPPFQSDNSLDTMRQVLEQEPVPPRQLNPNVPQDLETICLKCLEKNPRRRYSFARHLASDLQRFLNGEPVDARPISSVARLGRWCQRKPVVAALSAGMVLALVFGTGFSTWFGIRASQNETKALELAGEKESLAEEALQLAEEKETLAERAMKLASEKVELAEQEQLARLEAERQTDATAWNLYVARMFPMEDVWQSQDYGQLQRLLDESIPQNGEPDFRGWEWYYFRDQCQKASIRIGEGLSSPFVDWCSKTGLIAVPGRGKIRVYDASGRLERTLPIPGLAWKVMWNPTGTHIAFSDYTINAFVVRVSDGLVSPLNGGHDNTILSLAWSQDGSKLATSDFKSGHINIWNSSDLSLVKSMPAPDEHRMHVSGLDWHSDGIRLAVSGRHKSCSVWNTETGEALWRKYPGEATASGIAWNPEGTKLVSGNGHEAVIRDESGKILKSTPMKRIYSLSWSPDGKRIAAGLVDHSIAIWTLDADHIQLLKIHSSPVTTVHWSEDSQRLLSSSAKSGIHLSNVSTTQAESVFVPSGLSEVDISWHPSGERIATAPGGLIADAETGDVLETLDLRNGERTTTGRDGSLAWSPDGNRLVTVGPTQASIRDIASGNIVVQFPVKRDVTIINRVVWAAQTNLVSVMAKDGSFEQWDGSTGNRVQNQQLSEEAWAFDISPDGRLIAFGGGSGTSFGIWDIARQSAVRGKRYMGWMRSIAFHPNGEQFVAGDQSGRVWFGNSANGSPTGNVEGHKGPVYCVRYSPDGNRLATGSDDESMIIWDATTHRKLLAINCGAIIYDIEWSPNGRRIAVACSDGVRIFTADSSMPLEQNQPGVPSFDTLETTQHESTDLNSEGAGHLTEREVIHSLLQAGHHIRVGGQWMSTRPETESAVVTGVQLQGYIDPGIIGRLQAIPSLQTLVLRLGPLIPSDLAPLTRCSELRELTVEEGVVSRELVSTLRKLTGLERLVLGQVSFATDGMSALTALPLKEISISSSFLTDEDLPDFHEFSRLERIEFVGTRVTSSRITSLRSEFPHLEISANTFEEDRSAAVWVIEQGGKVIVDEFGPSTQEQKVADLPKWPFRVTDIDLFQQHQVTDDDLSRFSDLIELKSLNLRGTGVTDLGLEHLANLENLEHLKLGETDVTGSGFPNLKTLHKLRTLTAYHIPLTNETIQTIPEMPSLTHFIVSIEKPGIDENCFGIFDRLPNLYTLELLDAATISGDGFQNLHQLDDLQILRLHRARISDESMSHLAGIQNLKILDLVAVRSLSDDGFVHLKDVSSLEWLRVSRTRFGDQALEALATLPRLTYIEVSETNVTPAGVSSFQMKRPNCTVVE